jgi:hypothetical protein
MANLLQVPQKHHNKKRFCNKKASGIKSMLEAFFILRYNIVETYLIAFLSGSILFIRKTIFWPNIQRLCHNNRSLPGREAKRP